MDAPSKRIAGCSETRAANGKRLHWAVGPDAKAVVRFLAVEYSLVRVSFVATAGTEWAVDSVATVEDLDTFDINFNKFTLIERFNLTLTIRNASIEGRPLGLQ